jgi:ferritin-like protein
VDVLVDDRLLIEELLVGIDRRGARLYTTSYWYYRACRASVVGAGGHLSGPFQELQVEEQRRAIASMLQLPEEIGLAEPRQVVPIMVDVSGRHPALNLLNLEAVATARFLGATVWLSPKGASGILPSVLDSEDVAWETVTLN